jgi:hypothetical protein
MSNGPSIFEGLWLGGQFRQNKLEAEALSWEKTAKILKEKLDKANEIIIDVASSRDAYRELCAEIITELSDPSIAPSLSKPENKPVRQKFYFEKKKQVAIQIRGTRR